MLPLSWFWNGYVHEEKMYLWRPVHCFRHAEVAVVA